MKPSLVFTVLLVTICNAIYPFDSATPQFNSPPNNYDRKCYVQEIRAYPYPNVAGSPEDIVKHIGFFTELSQTATTRKGAKGLIKTPQNIEFVRAQSHFFSCIDPRATYAILGTPGGDMGEFVLALHAMEKHSLTPRVLSHFEINDFFQDYLSELPAFGKRFFYLHTDRVALDKVKGEAGVDDPLNPKTSKERDQVLKLFGQPENMGCKHLRALVEKSAEYGTRPALVQSAVQAFYNVLLDKSNPRRGFLLHTVSEGECSGEAPLAVIYSPVSCKSYGPLIVPNTGARQVAPLHKHASYYREDLARYFAAKHNLVSKRLFAEMERTAERHRSVGFGYARLSFDVVLAKRRKFWEVFGDSAVPGKADPAEE